MSNIINFYEQLPKAFKGAGKPKYKNYDKVKVEIPCRMLIAGVSGAGKSNFVLNVISQVNAWQRVYLFAKQLDQPLYKWLIEVLGKGNIIASDKIEDLPVLNEFDKNISNLCIFDDFICDDAKTQKKIAEIYVRGRNMNVSPIYLTQSYFATDKMIRRNSDYIAIVKINTKKDLARIIQEYSLSEMTPDQLMAVYNKIKEQGFGNVLMIDTNTNDKSLKFRMNFSPIEQPAQ